MKGIVLAGGKGTRLYPLTLAVSKQLLPVYDKPMIYYSIAVLMLAKIREICIITTPEDMQSYKRLLGSGEQWGVEFTYVEQPKPEGLAQAFILAEEFIAGSPTALILGDNLFYGEGFPRRLASVIQDLTGATVFAYSVNDPERYGIVTFDDDKMVQSLEEKPKTPSSNWAVTGLYFYDDQVCELAKSIRPSARGELEITDLNRLYLEQNRLQVQLMGRGSVWLDAGTHEALLDASEFVRIYEKRQGRKIACLEEIAFRNDWISLQTLIDSANSLSQGAYKDGLSDFVEFLTRNS